jgi:CheY-like chemotaxis protein/anti-sigma regulatory factor (Ser/Thr protein kinase)
VQQIEATSRSNVAKNANELIVECAPDLGVVVADTTKLRQAVLNLLSNAAKFTNNGKITLSVSRAHHGRREEIVIAVRDTGIGMSEAQREKLFANFSQADPSISAKYGGTGLGLALSQKLCRLMGGRIEVESELGVGSQFSIHLPVKPSEQWLSWEGRRGARRDDYHLPPNDEAPVILVISPYAAEAAEAMAGLSELGVNPIVANDIHTGLAASRIRSPALIMVDVLAPFSGELDPVRALKEAAGAVVPVVICASDTEGAEAAAALGADGAISKTMDREVLSSLLARHGIPTATEPHGGIPNKSRAA